MSKTAVFLKIYSENGHRNQSILTILSKSLAFEVSDSWSKSVSLVEALKLANESNPLAQET